MAAARSPEIYAACGVPDTMDGRLEAILLHVILVLDRLKMEGSAGQRLGQRLMEALVADLDDAYRQMGFGDDSIARRVPKLAGALGERARDYGMAPATPTGSASGDGAQGAPASGRVEDTLETALLNYVYRPADAMAAAQAMPGTLRLAAHVRRCRAALATLSRERLLAGEVDFAPFA